MAVLNPEHFFDLAEQLTGQASAGRPRQVNLRRAISTVYYGVFHAVLAAVAEHFVGATKHGEKAYALVYRSIDHKHVRNVCAEVEKRILSDKYRPYVPAGGFGQEMKRFATAFRELQLKRLAADYDPATSPTRSDTSALIAFARAALSDFDQATDEDRAAFLALLAFPPR